MSLPDGARPLQQVDVNPWAPAARHAAPKPSAGERDRDIGFTEFCALLEPADENQYVPPGSRNLKLRPVSRMLEP